MTDDNERILDEATDWLLSLADTPGDPIARARFSTWLAADPRNGEVWRELNHSYDLIGEAQPAPATAAPIPEVREPRPRRQRLGQPLGLRRKHWAGPHRRAFVAAGMGALAAGLMVWLAPAALLLLHADYSTGTGEMRTVALEDGSTAQLGPETAIRVAFSGGQRRVELLEGKALFQVRPNPARPFRVSAGTVTTTVLGTGFDVRLSPTATRVGVQHGHVRVDDSAAPAHGPTFLSAGDMVRIDAQGAVRTDHAAPALIASWALAEVDARDRTIAEVIDDIRPWYRGRIILMGEKLATRRVNGVYYPRDAAQAIRSLIGPGGGTVTEVTPWLIIVR